MKKKSLVSLLSATVLSTSLIGATPVQANDYDAQINEAQVEAEESQQAANELDALIDQLTNDVDSTQDALNNLNYEIQKNETLLIETNANLDEINKEMNQLLEELEMLVENIERRSIKLDEQAREIQINGNSANYFEYILNSESLTDVWARVNIVSNIIKSSNIMMEEQVKDKEAVAQKSEETERKVIQQNALVDQLQVATTNLESQKASQEALVAQLEIERSVVSSDKDALLAKRNEALQRVSNIEHEKEEAARIQLAAEEKAKEEKQLELARAEEARKEAAKVEAASEVSPASSVRENSDIKAPSKPSTSEPEVNEDNSAEEVEKPSPPTPTPPPTNQTPPPVNNGGWLRPSNGYVSSRYGPRWGTIHTGIDLAGSGDIVAAKSGTVTTVAYDAAGYGNYVIISHGNGLSSLYAHLLNDVTVSVGQRVEQGQRLGTMGSTGFSTGVHLHFEIRENGVRKDPELFMNF